ncbi:MAG: hypothetical protein K6G33_03445 [Ruminococcus sp.]|uniref:hypothetical protein n=1 Tax=Ruminococcus sp. TaxID=41978 RepID=UPI0025FF1686|nr:hypothetical protein [Ruminococcus sp.]MCR5599785.1 hypothetical protein [Ruminococcus sp.]
MDKKALCAALVLAVSAVTAGCDDKEKPKPKDEDIPVTSDSFGDYAEDTAEYREIADNEFKNINLATNIIKSEAPVEVECIDLSGIELGERVPVCFNEQNVEAYVRAKQVYVYDRNEHADFPFYDWHDFVNKPVKGCIKSIYVRGRECFLNVVYEVMLDYTVYDQAVLRYDADSGVAEEIYSWSSSDVDEYADRRCIFAYDSVFFTYCKKFEDNSDVVLTTVKRLDLDTGEVTTVTQTSLEDDDTHDRMTVYIDTYGELKMSRSIVDDTSGEVISSETLVYNNESDRFEKSAEMYVSDEVKTQAYFGGKRYYLVKPEGKRKLDIVCDSYRVGTGQTSGDIVYADDACIVLKTKEKVHYYDLTKKEHCIFDATGFGDNAVMCDGKLFMGRNASFELPVYCIIPQLGMAYPITESGLYDDFVSKDGKVIFSGGHMENIEIRSNDSESYQSHSFDVIDRIYIVNSR